MNGKFAHISSDGKMTDVTEGVQALYDLVLGSMDWGSGFLSYEDALPVVAIAKLAGFGQWEEAERYAREALHKKEAEAWLLSLPWKEQSTGPRAYRNGRPVPHDHVYSSVGKCMWSYCNAKQDQTATSVKPDTVTP